MIDVSLMKSRKLNGFKRIYHGSALGLGFNLNRLRIPQTGSISFNTL